MDKDTETVARVLQSGYGDATQTALDREVAAKVLTALRGAGWCGPGEVALIVEAAGGSVTISDDAVWDAWHNPAEAPTLLRERIPSRLAIRLSTRRIDRHAELRAQVSAACRRAGDAEVTE